METVTGGLYDQDSITAIIKKWINRPGQHSILIIDDIDRLDPDHIFRILNVFSAHFGEDYYGVTQNKFGFDKVILVADYNNIRNLFHHRYGEKADFAGYMDKFYSTEVYHFDNNAVLTSIIKRVFDSFTYKNVKVQKDGFHSLLFDDGFLLQLMTLFVSAGRIRLRSLIRIYGRHWDIHRKVIRFSSKQDPIEAFQFPMVIRLRFLHSLLGDPVVMDRLLEECQQKEIPFEPSNQFFGSLLLVINYRWRNYLSSSEAIFDETFERQQIAVSPQINGAHLLLGAEVANRRGIGKARQIEATFSPSPVEFWIALRGAIDELRRISYIS